MRAMEVKAEDLMSGLSMRSPDAARREVERRSSTSPLTSLVDSHRALSAAHALRVPPPRVNSPLKSPGGRLSRSSGRWMRA